MKSLVTVGKSVTRKTIFSIWCIIFFVSRARSMNVSSTRRWQQRTIGFPAALVNERSANLKFYRLLAEKPTQTTTLRTYVRSARTEFQKCVEISSKGFFWHVQFLIQPAVLPIMMRYRRLARQWLPLVGASVCPSPSLFDAVCVIEWRETVLCDRRRDLCAFVC